MKIIAVNRKASYEYHLEGHSEVGIVLLGSEIKTLVLGGCNIAESYVTIEDGEAWLINSTIEPYRLATIENHEPKRKRKLLLHRKEINKIAGKLNREGYSIIPTKIYFNNKGKIKLEIALGKGKKLHDKRETIKSREWDREKARALKNG